MPDRENSQPDDSILKDQAPESPAEASRRRFVGKALAAASALVAGKVLDSPTLDAAGDAKICVTSCVAPATPGGTNCGLDLEAVGEIKSSGGVLRSLLICAAENRSVPYVNLGFPVTYDCRITTLRAYQGYQGFDPNPANLRTKAPVMTPAGLTRVSRPGPTFRSEVGDLIQILFLNRIDEKKYFKTSTKAACDVVQGVYPNQDKMPNCFHGGNTTNLHFHGTHVTPSGFGDNVLIQILPDASARPGVSLDMMKLLQAKPDNYATDPLFQHWKSQAEGLVDSKAKDLKGADQKLEAAGEWPEYWYGVYPYSFRIPKFGRDPVKMGQAPGTHWYHAHKHGAAALQLLNGMSGAFIIEGDYDRELRAALPGIQEKVLVIQQFDSVPNQERKNPPAAPALQVNGQLQPVIKMRPGEIQWWRIINATIQANQINTFGFVEAPVLSRMAPSAQFTLPAANQRGNVAKFRLIAKDGVQFAWRNYDRHKNDTEFRLAQGNRVDILVQAPMTTGAPIDMVLAFAGLGQTKNPNPQNTVLRVRVESASGPPVPTQFPVAWEPDPMDPTKPRGPYLTFPQFLADITDAKTPARPIVFGILSGGVGAQPQFSINGKQFQDGVVDQCMVLDTAEEWLITNQTTVPHPFHIHVNPFQVIEYFDPSQTTQPVLQAPYIWQDTIEIPAASGGQNGYVRMRSRFADFTGKYVLHCHILGHEDRGMMQIVEVRANSCPPTPYSTAVTHGH